MCVQRHDQRNKLQASPIIRFGRMCAKANLLRNGCEMRDDRELPRPRSVGCRHFHQMHIREWWGSASNGALHHAYRICVAHAGFVRCVCWAHCATGPRHRQSLKSRDRPVLPCTLQSSSRWRSRQIDRQQTGVATAAAAGSACVTVERVCSFVIGAVARCVGASTPRQAHTGEHQVMLCMRQLAMASSQFASSHRTKRALPCAHTRPQPVADSPR